MIGSHLDMDMQYDIVSQKILRYKREHLQKSKIKRPIIEESEDIEADSDFEDELSARYPEDDLIYNKVLSRVCRRIKFFTRK